ncbi:metal-dependent transcriptional regulator [Cellulomonas fimi]|uniref:Iron (Metal) dependent repressor, DtxR family n=1 Tax=Cellulomonas fimi (strain ATCC 484 / DSM 20113 / JCM 1341 / CCUG 24087 / LMG 16345 / NBRC 15513 / NCIMB 8980 / NCTC 7547 / NRS-133) TaxID=590998 RepID=F4GZF6_CELFA|nr:metal-dependent transcriptional regulator [Cellulomonas fimi]AEE44877.1 iron (metal) dependent repressor, DtxR family [Cellulomonas fimi ATCC 484]NNH08112.1 metal-dependent transcriptional regulator [Cellulomonas fimi]VEH27557.1 Iron-dependent repressor IdeR [Cellulomonas fimi]
MSDLIDTTEMYLKTIYELTEEGRTPLRARIAERLGHSGPTVSQTVARMERDGLVVVTGDRHLELTDLGYTKAVRVMRKHRLAERLLTDVIGLEWPYVHEEACRWEHVMSERVEKRLAALLDHPHFDPYGNPIPGLAEIGEEVTRVNFLDGVTPLTAVPSADGTTVVVVRIAEPLQVDVELLTRLAEAGVRPGGDVTVERGDGVVTVGVAGSGTVLDLPDDVARHIFVGTR